LGCAVGGAVVEELLVPEVEEVDGEIVLLADVGDGLFLQEVETEQGDLLLRLKWRRWRGMDVPPREYCR
jgi:hypothetical protein